MTHEFDWEYTWKDSKRWFVSCDPAFAKVSMLESKYITI